MKEFMNMISEAVSSGIVQLVFYFVVLFIFGAVGKVVVKYLRTEAEESKAAVLEARTANEAQRKQIVAKLLNYAADLVDKCVAYTNQLLVDNWKRENTFDKAAQAVAFKETADKVKMLISDEARAAIEDMYGDFNEWLKLSIEAAVFEKKTATLAIAEGVEAVPIEAVTGGDENAEN